MDTVSCGSEEEAKPGILSRRWVQLICIVLFVAAGLTIRLEDLTAWKEKPEVTFYKDAPLLLNFDGYFYLRLARDLAEGVYTQPDELRRVPEHPSRPWPPPLLSVLACGIEKVTPLSMEWVGALLPAALGVLVVFPVLGIGRMLGGNAMGMTAALMVVLSNSYMQRTALGWFDTDCMILTFSMAIIYFFMKFSLEQSSRRYLFFGGATGCFLLFLWWWDQSPSAVVAITALPLVVSLLFFYRPSSRREGVAFFSVLGLGFVVAVAILGFDTLIGLGWKIYGSFSYISKEQGGVFPNVGVLVIEQAKPGLDQIIKQTTANQVSLGLALFGFILLCIRQWKKALFLLAPFALSVMALLYAQRFILFIAPISALGFGYLVYLLWEARNIQQFRLRKVIAFSAPVLVILVAGISFYSGMMKNYWPSTRALLIEGMDHVHENTSDNSVVFGWWDYGYAFQYWARRPTVTDGQFHGGEQTVYNALPLASSDFRLSANFIQFYVSRGLKGFATLYQGLGGDKAKGLDLIKAIHGAGPAEGLEIIRASGLTSVGEVDSYQKWLEFLFPGPARPVYLFLDFRLVDTSQWWYFMGTWDIQEQAGLKSFYSRYLGLGHNGDLVGNSRDILGNMTTGKILLPSMDLQAGSINLFPGKGQEPIINSYGGGTGYHLDIYLPMGFAVLQDKAMRDSVFNRLFIRHEQTPYFVPEKLFTPAYQIYLVQGESAEVVGTEKK